MYHVTSPLSVFEGLLSAYLIAIMIDMDEIPDLSDLIGGIGPALAEALHRAYVRGYEAGGEAMRETIFQAAARPFQGTRYPDGFQEHGIFNPAKTQTAPTPSVVETGLRAPRGSVTRAIARVLGESPGLSTREVREYVSLIDEQVSPKSIDNELSRHRDDRYRYDDGKWFLIGAADKETAEEPEWDPSAVNLT